MVARIRVESLPILLSYLKLNWLISNNEFTPKQILFIIHSTFYRMPKFEI
jgi:hypothetical protein